LSSFTTNSAQGEAVEPAQKIDIKSELYRAAMPHIKRLTTVSLARWKELPKLDIAKNFILIYLAIGFIIEGMLSAFPSWALSLVGVSPGLVGLVFFLFWPIVTFFLGGEEHAVLSVALVFIMATYVSHFKQKAVDSSLALQHVQSGLLTADTRMSSSPIDANAAFVEIIPPASS
jgi:hypothetical protein